MWKKQFNQNAKWSCTCLINPSLEMLTMLLEKIQQICCFLDVDLRSALACIRKQQTVIKIVFILLFFSTVHNFAQTTNWIFLSNKKKLLGITPQWQLSRCYLFYLELNCFDLRKWIKLRFLTSLEVFKFLFFSVQFCTCRGFPNSLIELQRCFKIRTKAVKFQRMVRSSFDFSF